MPAAREILWALDFKREAGSDKFWEEIVINSFEKKGPQSAALVKIIQPKN